MKKLIKILSIITITSLGTSHVISCEDYNDVVNSKVDITNFQIMEINLEKDKITNQDVFDNIFNQLSDYALNMYVNVDVETLTKDVNLSITITEYLNDKTEITFDSKNNNENQHFAISGKFDANININANDQYFKQVNSNLSSTITIPENDKQDLSKLQIQDIDLSTNQFKTTGAVLVNVAEQITEFSGVVSINSIDKDLCLRIKITESDGTIVTNSDSDPNIGKLAVAGATNVEITVDAKDNFFIATNIESKIQIIIS